MNDFNFKLGKQKLLNGFITLSATSCPYNYYLERIEVPECLRRTGEFDRMIGFLVVEAKSQGVSIDASIAPDCGTDEIAEGMVRVFSRHGFKPLKMDGTIYRKDVSFEPMSYKKRKRKGVCV